MAPAACVSISPKTSSASAPKPRSPVSRTSMPSDGLLLDDVADVLAPVARLLEVGRDGEHRVGDRAVLGDQVGRRAGLERDLRGARSGGPRLLVAAGESAIFSASSAIFCLVGRVEAALVLVDDQAVGGLAARELLVEDLHDLGRLRALGQERGRCRRLVSSASLPPSGSWRTRRRSRGRATTHLLRRPVTIEASVLNETSCRVERRPPPGGSDRPAAPAVLGAHRALSVERSPSASTRSTEASNSARSRVPAASALARTAAALTAASQWT